MDGRLEVQVRSGYDLPGSTIYFKLQIDTISRKTNAKTNQRGGPVLFSFKTVFDIPDITQEGFNRLRVSLMEKNTFYSDEWLGGVEIPLDKLAHAKPLSGEFNVARDGKIRTVELYLNWKARDIQGKEWRARTFSSVSAEGEADRSARTPVPAIHNSGDIMNQMTQTHRDTQLQSAKRTQLVANVPLHTNLFCNWVGSICGSGDEELRPGLAKCRKAAFKKTLEKESQIIALESDFDKMASILYDTETMIGSLSVGVLELPAVTRDFSKQTKKPLVSPKKVRSPQR